jgi:translation initiation factor IF-3
VKPGTAAVAAVPFCCMEWRKKGSESLDARVNRNIRAREVRLIGEDGKQLGIKPVEEALRYADEVGLDLVEVDPRADPPVCRVMDYGKYRYEQTIRQKEARKKQTLVTFKEMKMRPKIDHHDYDIKTKHIRRFLEAGHKVKVTVMFRGREMSHTDLGEKLLKRLAEEISDLGTVESQPKLDGRNMVMILNPVHTYRRGETHPSTRRNRMESEEKQNAQDEDAPRSGQALSPDR